MALCTADNISATQTPTPVRHASTPAAADTTAKYKSAQQAPTNAGRGAFACKQFYVRTNSGD